MNKSIVSKLTIYSILVIVLILIFSYLIFAVNFKPIYVQEEKLQKNMEFALRPGDILVYKISYQNISKNISFIFGKKIKEISNFSEVIYENCTNVVLYGTNLSTCIKPDGVDINTNTNGSLMSPIFFFFSPWMLALSKNFTTWETKTMNTLTNEIIQSSLIVLLGNETIKNRESYVISIKENNAETERRIWVDKKTRILLKETGQDYTIELVQSPFPLEQQAQ